MSMVRTSLVHVLCLAVGSAVVVAAANVEASIITNDTVIVLSQYPPGTGTSFTDSRSLDVDEDGVDDFYFSHHFQVDVTPGENYVDIGTRAGRDIQTDNELVLREGSNETRFEFGDWIGPSNDTVAYRPLKLLAGADANVTEVGDWFEHDGDGADLGVTAYLGLRFERADGFHYGWAEVSFAANLQAGSIHGMAWESDPETAIQAGAIANVPEPGTLSLVGAGVAFVARRRPR